MKTTIELTTTEVFILKKAQDILLKISCAGTTSIVYTGNITGEVIDIRDIRKAEDVLATFKYNTALEGEMK